jgi:P4 family phage/plasmid primase-like protien
VAQAEGGEEEPISLSPLEDLAKCGHCRRFHTKRCPAEDPEDLKKGRFEQFEDSEPIKEGCFELNAEFEALLQAFTEVAMERFALKHFVKGDSSLGLHMWEDGAYVPAEERIKAFVERLGEAAGLSGKVRSRLVNEVVEKLKRKAFFELGESEPLRIAFRNVALDWRKLLSLNVEDALIPIERTKEEPIFHRIPWRLDVELLRKALKALSSEGGLQRVAEEEAPKAVEAFKAWVGEAWILLLEIIGYCLYPDYPFRKAFMLVGGGANGKSTFLRLLNTIVGEENVAGQSLQDLCHYPFSRSELYHKLANIFDDIPERPLAYTGYFKVLTGWMAASAPRKHRLSIHFTNYAKLIFSANRLPEVSDQSEAFWDRWIVIEFPNRFPEDPTFYERTFTTEVVERIIPLSIAAFVQVWGRKGFSVKGRAGDFKEFWLRKANSVYGYVRAGLEEGRLELSEEAYTPSEDLYEDYVRWADGLDLKPVEKATFTKELERNFKVAKKRIKEEGRTLYAYVGIRLKGGGAAPSSLNGSSARLEAYAEAPEGLLARAIDFAARRAKPFTLGELARELGVSVGEARGAAESLARNGVFIRVDEVTFMLSGGAKRV